MRPFFLYAIVWALVVFDSFAIGRLKENRNNVGNKKSQRLLQQSPMKPDLFQRKPLCYSQHEDRMKELPGYWYSAPIRSALYWNLSCPMEVSKQACSHFGSNTTHAEYAAHLQFEPKDCSLLSILDMLPFFAALNRTFVFIGNSLTREVLLGIACNAHSLGLIDRFQLQWQSCKQPHGYPCHGATNCITCGPHSGFEHTGAKVFFKSGTILEIVESYDTEIPHVFAKRNDSIDIVIAQRWHLEDRGLLAFALHRKKNNLPLPKLLWWNGFPAHFPTDGNLLIQGQFNETELERKKKSEGVIDCLSSVGSVVNRPFDNNKELLSAWPTSAFFQVADVHTLGSAKVGNVVGKYGDCQHFCSPGPADMLAIPLLQLILAMDHSS